jgi:hypothetical protein
MTRSAYGVNTTQHVAKELGRSAEGTDNGDPGDGLTVY